MGERELRVWAEGALDKLTAVGTVRRCEEFRTLERASGTIQRNGTQRIYLNFSSNDYLGLSAHPEVVDAAADSLRRNGCGVGSSRVLSGTRLEHSALEDAIANWLGKESALVFGAGYLANIGVLGALCGRHDAIVADRLVHASLLDGSELSGAKLFRYRHNDCDDLERQLARAAEVASRIAVVTESVFSMDGDIAPLDDILSVAERYNAFVVVDEAHALGVFGEQGAGVAGADIRERISIITGTLSKSCGSYGGFVACSAPVRDLLLSKARSFLFNTGLPAFSAAAALKAVELIREGRVSGSKLLLRASRLRASLQDDGLNTLASASQIVPIVVGSNEVALRLSAELETRGVYVPAIRSPTVPLGTERLRISLNLAHSDDEIAQLMYALINSSRGIK